MIQNPFTSTVKSQMPANDIVESSEAFVEIRRKDHFQKLWDYYMQDAEEIEAYLIAAMKKTFKTNTIEKMQLPKRLFVHKIIHRLALAYKYSAYRYLDEEAQDDKYQEMIEGSNIQMKAKEWNRLAKLLDTVYVVPVFRDEHIEYEIIPPHLITVKESEENFLIPESVTIPIAHGPNDMRYDYWTKDEHYALDSNGRRISDPENPDGKNPYGLLHYIPCRLKDTEDHWGEGDTNLVEANEMANILLASTYFNAIMGSHGQPIAINMNLDPKNPPTLGPDSIIAAENVDKDMYPPSFDYAKSGSDIAAALAMVDYIAKTAAMDRGIPPSSFSIDTDIQSGYAKEIDNLELMENRQDDIEALRVFERKLFYATIAVWNYHQPGKKIDPNSTFGVDFEDPSMPKTTDEELKQKEFDYKWGISSPVEEVVDTDSGIDEVKAEEIIRKNLELTQSISRSKTPEQLREPQQDDEDGI